MNPFVAFLLSNYKIIAVILAVISIIVGAYFKGRYEVQVEWDLEKAVVAKELAELRAKQNEKTVEVVTKYVDRVQIVKEKGDVITEYVDRWITKKDDYTYVLPGKFRVLHDAAARSEVPDTARLADEATPKVELSTTTRTITDNYKLCNETREQLISLQDWIVAMEKESKKAQSGNRD